MEDKAKKLYEWYTQACDTQGDEVEWRIWDELTRAQQEIMDRLAQRILSEGL